MGQAPESREPPAEPEIVGKYELLARLGSGRNCDVFLAVRRGAQRRRIVALKRLREKLTDRADASTALLREAELASQIKHAKVVDVYEYGSEDGACYIAMEYLPGQPLGALIRRSSGGLPAACVARIGADIADGLAAAHRLSDDDGKPLGLVHFDVSPSNIQVLYDGRVLLVDFGLARALSAEPGTRGKIGYLAPEQVTGRGNKEFAPDARIDLFALGTVLWEATTGVRLYREEDREATLRAITDRDAARASSVRSDLDPELDDILAKALARDPDDRYQSGRELAAALRGYLANTDATDTTADISALMLEHFDTERSKADEAVANAMAVLAGERSGPTARRAATVDDPEPDVPDVAATSDGGGDSDYYYYDDDDDDAAAGADIEQIAAENADDSDPAAGDAEAGADAAGDADGTDRADDGGPEEHAIAVAAASMASAHATAATRDEDSDDIDATGDLEDDDLAVVANSKGRSWLVGIAAAAMILVLLVVIVVALGGKGDKPVKASAGPAADDSASAAKIADNTDTTDSTDSAAETADGTDRADNTDNTDNTDNADSAANTADGTDGTDGTAANAGEATPGEAGDDEVARAEAEAARAAEEAEAAKAAAERAAADALAAEQAAAEEKKAEQAAAKLAAETAAADRKAAAAAEKKAASDAKAARAAKRAAAREEKARRKAAAAAAKKERAAARAKERAAAVAAGTEPKRDKGAARRAYQAGSRMLVTGNAGAAIRKYREALKAWPGYSPAFRGLGLANERRGKTKSAIRYYKRYLRASPRAKDAESIRARIRRLGG